MVYNDGHITTHLNCDLKHIREPKSKQGEVQCKRGWSKFLFFLFSLHSGTTLQARGTPPHTQVTTLSLPSCLQPFISTELLGRRVLHPHMPGMNKAD